MVEIDRLGDWKRTHYSSEISSSMDGKEVIVAGWVRAIRKVGRIIFIQLADRYGSCQIIAKPKDVPDKLKQRIESLGREDVVAIKGTVVANKEAPNGFEIIPLEIKVLNKSEAPLPLEVVSKKTPAEFHTRMGARYIDIRRPEVAAIFSIKDAVTTAIRNFLESNGFIEIHTPKILAEASEGGAEVFKIMYFNREAYLAQSPQFYKQMMMATGFDKVYEIAPAFRAEKSHTTRHIAEILMLDMEMAFISSVEDVMNVLERMMKYVCEFVSSQEQKALHILNKSIRVPELPFPRITMVEAKKMLSQRGLKYKPHEELDERGERILGELGKEKFGHDFIFLTEFPWHTAKFYHLQKEDNPKVAERCDLIYNGVEIATITAREYRYEKLLKQAKERGVDIKKIEFYLNAFRYGMPPHGGCGVGIDRIVKQMLGLENIQEAVLFPRTPERLIP